MTTRFESWGRYPKASHIIRRVDWLDEAIFPASFAGAVASEWVAKKGYLPFGQGRSYGDVCLNDGGVLLSTDGLDRLICFDKERGLLKCEAGVTLADILDFCVPLGWFLPVTPGTRYVSVGGAIGNDVHGKNHHRAGTFGCHVKQFLLLRSDGTKLICSPQQNPQLFSATIGGLGLTGLILWAEVQLVRIENAYIKMRSQKFNGLDEFFAISAEADKSFDYTVAWLDCVSGGKSFARGIFMGGNHAQSAELPNEIQRSIARQKFRSKRELLKIPFDFPEFALNKYSVKIFNTLYYNKQLQKDKTSFVRYEPFFYPLDAVGEWNRIYGKSGLLQFQCVVPGGAADSAIKDILKVVVDSGLASFLAVIKEFGDLKSPGMLSFPRKGVTLCLDLSNRKSHGAASEFPSLKVMAKLEAMVRESGGAMYPAKDACMSRESFEQFYPASADFVRYIDPNFSSSFARRVGLCEGF